MQQAVFGAVFETANITRDILPQKWRIKWRRIWKMKWMQGCMSYNLNTQPYFGPLPALFTTNRMDAAGGRGYGSTSCVGMLECLSRRTLYLDVQMPTTLLLKDT